MASTSRVGTGLLGICGLALAGLMAYTLTYQGCAGPGSPGSGHSVVAEVAVFFPDLRDWSHFSRAVEACTRRGLCTAIAESDDAIVVESSRRGRRIRFGRDGTRGIRETRDAVDRIADAEPRPIGVIGSSTTVLTVALAESLRDKGPAGPILLIPWATAIRAEGPVPLLAIDRGRTFRFCPNNRRLAGSVVDCLSQQADVKPPGAVFLVVDPHDPYSVDLSNCFREAILSKAPSAEIREQADTVGPPGVPRSVGAVITPSMAEVALADAIWTAADRSPNDRSTWVVLPIQGDPTRRMLSALQSRSTWQAPGRGGRPPQVICGDAIGRETLEAPGIHRSFPIWCASISSSCPPGLGVTDDTQTLAEIVSAVLLVVDQAPRPGPTPDDLRAALARIDLVEDDPWAFGRPLRFTPDGERKDDTSCVLATRPGVAGVIEFGPGRDGRWARTQVAKSAPPEVRP